MQCTNCPNLHRSSTPRGPTRRRNDGVMKEYDEQCSTFLKSSYNVLGTLIEAAKHGSVSKFIGRSRSEDSVCNHGPRGESASHSNSPASDEAITESPSDSNPSLDRPEVEASPDPTKHHHHHHNQQHHQREGSDKSHGGKTKDSSHHHYHLHFGALAALKRKRKKFSNSRNSSPVLEPPCEVAPPVAPLNNSSSKVSEWARCIFTMYL